MKTTTLIALLLLSTQQVAYANPDSVKEAVSFDEHRRHGDGERARGFPPQMKEEISQTLAQEELLGELWNEEYIENEGILSLIQESLHKKKPEHIEGQRPDMSEMLKNSLANEELLEKLKEKISKLDKSSVSAVISCSKKEQEEKKHIVPESATKLHEEVKKVEKVIAKNEIEQEHKEEKREDKKDRKEPKHKVAHSDLSRPSSEFHERPDDNEQDDSGRPFKRGQRQENEQEYAQVDIKAIKLELIMSLLKETSLFSNQGQMQGQMQMQMQAQGQGQMPQMNNSTGYGLSSNQMNFQIQGFGRFDAYSQQQQQPQHMGYMGNMGTQGMMSSFPQRHSMMPQQQGAQVLSQDYGIFNMDIPSQNIQVNRFNNLNTQQNFGIMF